MLLEAKLVHVPAHPERDADLNEFGHLSLKVRAGFGDAAIEAGSPDFGLNEFETDAADAIANILHALHREGLDVDAAVETARMHFTAETSGEVI